MCSDINHFHFLQAKDVNLFYEEFTTICAVSLRLHDTPMIGLSLVIIGLLIGRRGRLKIGTTLLL